ncbi:mitochondrial ribosomal protein L48 (predicted), isoform CRA_b [Rattus norvegicus]|uniref:Mitochondrial ribosomal protein L48 (Predicted), isoform CRA_b n=1 Tax=Rattus norvegicus TaxID=10116 RepID=A6I6Q1_RAT|nr:mitochondrial ribosomal protein L48 (predicted), isoform CRA_b [Rattus norvegicus]
MSGTLGKVLGLWTNTVSKQGFSLQRFRILGENPIYSAGEGLLCGCRGRSKERA